MCVIVRVIFKRLGMKQERQYWGLCVCLRRRIGHLTSPKVPVCRCARGREKRKSFMLEGIILGEAFAGFFHRLWHLRPSQAAHLQSTRSLPSFSRCPTTHTGTAAGKPVYLVKAQLVQESIQRPLYSCKMRRGTINTARFLTF